MLTATHTLNGKPVVVHGRKGAWTDLTFVESGQKSKMRLKPGELAELTVANLSEAAKTVARRTYGMDVGPAVPTPDSLAAAVAVDPVKPTATRPAKPVRAPKVKAEPAPKTEPAVKAEGYKSIVKPEYKTKLVVTKVDGKRVMDNGDWLSVALRGKSLADLYVSVSQLLAIAPKHKRFPVGDEKAAYGALVAAYSKLNLGQQAMNLRNIYRALQKPAEEK
jgi:hypothetical protein